MVTGCGWRKKLEETASFYVEILGFRAVRVEPSNERPESTLLFVDVGSSSQLVFSDLPCSALPDETRSAGSIHHLAIRVDPDRLNDILRRMHDHGITFTGPIRKHYTSVYVRDPDNVFLEFMAGERISVSS